MRTRLTPQTARHAIRGRRRPAALLSEEADMLQRYRATAGSCAFVTALIALAWIAHAQTPIENSAETRFQLDVHVPDGALAPMLPTGFALNVAAQGPAKDANLRVIFVDR